MIDQNLQAHAFIRSVAWGVITGVAVVSFLGACYYFYGANVMGFLSRNLALAIVGFSLHAAVAPFIYRWLRRLRGLPAEPSMLDWAWWAGYIVPMVLVASLLYVTK
jgi:hypothetical protein